MSMFLGWRGLYSIHIKRTNRNEIQICAMHDKYIRGMADPSLAFSGERPAHSLNHTVDDYSLYSFKRIYSQALLSSFSYSESILRREEATHREERILLLAAAISLWKKWKQKK
jgi:hypothetical protein